MNYCVTDYKVGEKVVITPASFENILNGNRCLLNYPCDAVVETARALIGRVGTVTRRFTPGYEMNVEFPSETGTITLHMKDHWVERT